MSDLKRALAYLGRDKLRYLDMLEPLRRGSVDVLHAWEDGVLLHDMGCGGWFAAADSADALERMLSLLPTGVDLFVGHETEHKEWMAERLGLHDGHTCCQVAWTRENPPLLPADVPPLVRLGAEWAEFVHEHYSHSFADAEYMRGAIKRGMLGVFVGENLAGYIGTHDEGTMGMLEVLPQYRRRGLGELLTLGAIRQAFDEGRYAFDQVIEGNEASFALQRKMGMEICDKTMYWLY